MALKDEDSRILLTIAQNYYKRRHFDVKLEYTEERTGKIFLRTPCYYCDAPAECIDHTFPVSVLAKKVNEPGFKVTNRIHYSIVPSCNSCNSMLGAKVFKTLEERKRWVTTRRRNRDKEGTIRQILAQPTHNRQHRGKLQKELREIKLQRQYFPNWTQEEINELGPGLKDWIDNSVSKRYHT